MKKILISIFVILLFTTYSIYHRIFSSNLDDVIAPKVMTNLVSPSNTPTFSPSNTPVPTLSSGNNSNPTSAPSITPTPTPKPTSPYKDGTYTGDSADAFYGNIQVQVTIQNGKMTNISFLQAPNDRGTSIAINSQADPMLAQEAIQTQNANVNIVSGATDSSSAFVESLQSALSKAKN